MQLLNFLTIALPVVAAIPNRGGPQGGKYNKHCPTNTAQPDGLLGKSYVDTSALVQISRHQPDRAFPASQKARITPNSVCTIFNLELPVAETQGKVCNLVFDFPAEQGHFRRFFFEGPGSFNFTGYAVGAGAVPGETTFNKQPAPGPSPPNPPAQMRPGNSYIINSAPCGIPADTPAPKVTVSGSLCSHDTTLKYEQSTEGCPLGFFVVLTDA